MLNLSYQEAPKRSARVRRFLAFWFVVFTAVTGAIAGTMWTLRRSRDSLLERELLRANPPAGTIAYEGDIGSAISLLQSNPALYTHLGGGDLVLASEQYATALPDVSVAKFRQALGIPPRSGQWAMLFCARLQTRSGGRRLVILDMMDPSAIESSVFSTASSLRGLQLLRSARILMNDATYLVLGRPGIILAPRLYFGAIDPKDSSHFTIDCVIGSHKTKIDGWLLDDNFVRISVRGGPELLEQVYNGPGSFRISTPQAGGPRSGSNDPISKTQSTQPTTRLNSGGRESD